MGGRTWPFGSFALAAAMRICFSRSESRDAMFFSTLYIVLPVVLVVAFTLIMATVKVLREYERAVVFTLGRFQKVKGPGLVLLIPFVQEMVRVDLRIQVRSEEHTS